MNERHEIDASETVLIRDISIAQHQQFKAAIVVVSGIARHGPTMTIRPWGSPFVGLCVTQRIEWDFITIKVQHALSLAQSRTREYQGEEKKMHHPSRWLLLALACFVSTIGTTAFIGAIAHLITAPRVRPCS